MTADTPDHLSDRDLLGQMLAAAMAVLRHPDAGDGDRGAAWHEVRRVLVQEPGYLASVPPRWLRWVADGR